VNSVAPLAVSRRSASAVAPVGSVPPAVVTSWLRRMLAPPATSPLALRLPSSLTLPVADAVVVVPSGIVTGWSSPTCTLPSSSAA
jgi:hypothetical protein